MRRLLVGSIVALLAGLAACTEYAAFDSTDYLRRQMAKEVGETRAARIAVPFELDAEITRYWRTLVEANRDRLVVPGNPDLVLPGQELALPTR